ncbi:hypothetical protein EOD42_18140 [Rhodovarius crocodyli]|uniref:PRC-barrel domain containing protein n=1 Tax=Rhodovarius crocodyli TaxID=1979269 RepID=A0A437M364_9PROT|nr:hypothetical protein [Rhodovarius crocodyli]RVT92139.1 hypothetical protein EOD42_18140 [Rhodovarius crocodyli]
MSHAPSITLLGALLAWAGPAAAQHPANAPPPPAERSAEARARYPQPVRVGDLLGRQVLEDSPQQTVLGRVAGVTRDTEGVAILVDCCGILGFGTRRVALPVETMTLLGQFMVARGQDRQSMALLPAVAPARAAPLPVDASIRVGLGRN